MKSNLFILFFIIVLLGSITVKGQNQIVGRVLNSNTKKPIPNATIILGKTEKQTTSNAMGFFQIDSDTSDYLTVKSPSYLDVSIKVPKDNFQVVLFENIKPDYKGGYEEFYKSFVFKVKYPGKALAGKLQRKIYAQFEVDSLNGIQNIQIFNDVQNLFGPEIIRALQVSQGNWIPKSTSAILVLPISFQIKGIKKKGELESKVEIPKGELLSEMVVTATISH